MSYADQHKIDYKQTTDWLQKRLQKKLQKKTDWLTKKKTTKKD